MTTTTDIQAVPDIKGRIAPTPSGYLHKGNGFSFVLSWLMVRRGGGKLLLRIDDADTARARPEYLDDIFRCLEWLGLDWDEGPIGPGHFQAHYSQEKRFPLYHQVLENLRLEGLIYTCGCSRSQLKATFVDGIYRGACREGVLAFTDPALAWRIKVQPGDVCFKEINRGMRCLPLDEQMGDFVVRRKGGFPAYQIASLVDDISWGSNLIVRGEDLLTSTAAQVYLAQSLAGQTSDQALQKGAKAFQQARFLHHPLLLDEKGEKLSKSAGSTSLKNLREAGGNPMTVYALVADYLKLPADAAASLNDLLEGFKGVRE